MGNVSRRQATGVIAAAAIAAILMGGGGAGWSQGQQQQQPSVSIAERLMNAARGLAEPGDASGGLRGRDPVFVRVGDIKAEVTERTHYEWMKAIWVGYEITRPEPVATGGRSSKAAFSAVRMIKEVDKATPALAVACASGRRIPEVEFHFMQTAGGRTVVYMRILLKNATVVGVVPVLMRQGRGTFVHLEEVSFDFEEVEWEYTPFDENGKASAPVRAGWSVAKNKGF